MTSFKIDQLLILDLRDDFIMNEKQKLYDFLGKDPVKAFYLGIYVNKWFNLLEKKQQYLHSKLLRHNQEEVQKYSDQIKYWTTEFSNSPSEEVELCELSEYIFNHIIWDQKNEKEDQIKVALFLGMIVGKQMDLDDEDLIYNINEK